MSVHDTVSPSAPSTVGCAMSEPLIEVRGLEVGLRRSNGTVTAIVRNVDLRVAEGEIVGIVGESGSGKSVLSLALMALLGDDFEVSADRLRLAGTDVGALGDRDLDRFRGRVVSMVFQDPASALNPLRTVGSLLGEAQRLHNRRLSRDQVRRRSIEMLREVGFPDPERRLRVRPHQLSGGLRQRLLIAMAMVNDPKVVIADEPTTALDTTIQAQVIDLLESERAGRATILVTHDLDLAGSICNTIAVMYAGTFVEVGPASRVLASPQHPYTAGLLAAAPRFGSRETRLRSIPGAPPGLDDIRPPCAFEPRCDRREGCNTTPPLETRGGSQVACWHPLEVRRP